MAGTITPSKHKYMSDFHPPEKKFWIHAWHNAMLIESEHRLCCNAINAQRSQNTFELPLLKCKIRNPIEFEQFFAESSFKLRYDLHVHV